MMFDIDKFNNFQQNNFDCIFFKISINLMSSLIKIFHPMFQKIKQSFKNLKIDVSQFNLHKKTTKNIKK